MLIAPQQELNLISTNVPDNPEPTYDNTATYNKGDKVQLSGKIYECLQDNTTGANPKDNPIVWMYLETINKMKMFDPYMNTHTENEDNIEVSMSVSDVDVLGLFGIEADTVDITITNNLSGEEVFNKTITTTFYEITDWYEWTYANPKNNRKIFINLPMYYSDATLTVKINKVGGIAKCANIAYGRSEFLGATLWGSTTSFRSNTTKKRNTAGYVFLQKGISWDRVSLDISVDTSLVDTVKRRLADTDGIPTLFIGDEREGGFESLLVFGFFRDFDIPISVSKSKYTIEVEGV